MFFPSQAKTEDSQKTYGSQTRNKFDNYHLTPYKDKNVNQTHKIKTEGN